MLIYQELANGIVARAAEDYRNALKGIGYDRKPAESVIIECESFFRSSYYRMLTKVDCEYLMEQIKKEVKSEANESNSNTSNP